MYLSLSPPFLHHIIAIIYKKKSTVFFCL